MEKSRKIVVGMSGGVDSSAAAALLKEQGWEVIGVSLLLPTINHPEGNKEATERAKEICRKLSIKHHTIDVRKDFEEKIVKYFVDEYHKARTPNPCVICNRNIKFLALFSFAEKHGIKHIATGHYAQIKDGKLLKGADKEKDQSYYLAFLPSNWIEKIVFPLGELTKEEVHKKAKTLGFSRAGKRKESQDFCYLSGKPLSEFLEERIGEKPGDIVNTKGKILGKHKGLHNYTIGQRKGIELPGGPYFVKKLDTKENTLVVTKDEDQLLSKEAHLTDVNYISGKTPEKEIKVEAKVRYQSPLAKASLNPESKDTAKIVFEKSHRAITPGQACVFYTGEICLGGGIIKP